MKRMNIRPIVKNNEGKVASEGNRDYKSMPSKDCSSNARKKTGRKLPKKKPGRPSEKEVADEDEVQ